MIFVNRASPARIPADSGPTIFFTGSFVGPVMIHPRESVLTAVEKKRSGRGASRVVASTSKVKAPDNCRVVAPPEPADVSPWDEGANRSDSLFAMNWTTVGARRML